MSVLGQRRLLGRSQERPRHPEENQKRKTRLEPNNQILAATIDQRDALAVEPVRELERGERAGTPRGGDSNILEGPALEDGRKLSTDGLDLGQLGHRRTVAAAP